MRNDRLDFFFTMTATLRPSRLFKTCAMTVVLPAPRKPDKTVSGPPLAHDYHRQKRKKIDLYNKLQKMQDIQEEEEEEKTLEKRNSL